MKADLVITTTVRIIGLICLCSCEKSNWSDEHIHSTYPDFSYSKLIFHTNNPIHGLDVEIVKREDQFRAYLIVHSTPLPASRGTGIQAIIEIDECALKCEADRFEGGQRFLLSESMTKKIIEALMLKKSVTISIPGYRSVLTADKFKEHFKKLNQPSRENPFHLPF